MNSAFSPPWKIFVRINEMGLIKHLGEKHCIDHCIWIMLPRQLLGNRSSKAPCAMSPSTFQSSPGLDGVFAVPGPLFDLFGFTECSANYSKDQLGKEKTGAGSGPHRPHSLEERQSRDKGNRKSK